MNLDPFDLSGPQFLLFYVAMIGLLALAVRLANRFAESGEAGEADRRIREVAEDPYQIAFLRGGRYESIRVALLSLVERGLLETDSNHFVSSDDQAVDKMRHPIEKAILTRISGSDASVAYSDTAVLAEADMIGEVLQQQRLIAGPAVQTERRRRVSVATVILWAVAGVKIFVALSRGRTNIGFLILLAFLAPVVLSFVARRFRTTLGDQVFAGLRSLFESLRDRREALRLHATQTELAFLAAAFGMGALSSGVWSHLTPLQSKPPSQGFTGLGGGGSGCGGSSSCGSASSCGGSSCGGGGCGGGCGGCGG